jgi:hypothetical protein
MTHSNPRAYRFPQGVKRLRDRCLSSLPSWFEDKLADGWLIESM